MNKTAKKALIITGIVLGSIVVLFLLLYAVLAIIGGVAYKECRKLREYVCTIPEIGSGYAPQGIGYSEEQDLYIMTGYDKNDSTVMYLVKNNAPTRVYLADKDGNELKGHAGGVTCTKDYVYVANGHKLDVYSLNELINANGSRVSALSHIPVDNTAAFCFSDDSNIYVGEFYRPGNYETDSAHHYTTPNGDDNKAIVSCYPLDGDGAIGAAYPEYAISVTGLVQGFAVKDGRYMLSRSYGLKNSKLEYYSGYKDDGATVTISFELDPELGEKQIPLYYLDSTNLVKSLTLPAFSEDLTIKGDRVVVTNESACNKYVVGKLFGANKVYSFPIKF
ncbi:MAG: hypothetical protein J1G04_03450 [Clostridiales bacterium]|nr:hypothetical protein [Clostridiales bacterium]